MKKEKNPVEQYRIYICEHTKNIIESDIQAFNLPRVKKLSSFVNRLILSYYDKNGTFFPRAKNKLKIKEELGKISEQENFDNSILENIYNIVEGQKSTFPETGFRDIHIKPSSELLSVLKKYSFDERKVLHSSYVEPLIDDYINKPYDERERIFFSSTFDMIEDAIENKKNLIYKIGKKTTYNIIPYKLLTSTPTYYSYLVGKATRIHPNFSPEYKPVSLRVSYLNSLEMETSHISKQLSTEDIEELKACIKERGIQFVTFESKSFKVKLTPEGIKDYNKYMNIRPIVKSIEPYKDGSRCKIYNFTCSENQIEAYFFKFGAKAEILEPEETRKRFKEHYQAALNLYSE